MEFPCEKCITLASCISLISSRVNLVKFTSESILKTPDIYTSTFELLIIVLSNKCSLFKEYFPFKYLIDRTGHVYRVTFPPDEAIIDKEEWIKRSEIIHHFYLNYLKVNYKGGGLSGRQKF